MTWGTLWTLLPDEVLPLLLAGAGVLLILGVIAGRTVLGILVLLFAIQIFSPFLGPIFEGLPTWLLLIALVLFLLATLRNLATPLIGAKAAGSLVSTLVTAAIKFTLALLLFPFRVLGWVFGLSGSGKA